MADRSRLARRAGFVRRRRKVTGSNFDQASVCSFLGDPHTTGSAAQCMAAAVGPQADRQPLE